MKPKVNRTKEIINNSRNQRKQKTKTKKTLGPGKFTHKVYPIFMEEIILILQECFQKN